MNPTLADRVSLRTLRWGDHEGGSAISPPFEVIIAADVIHPQNAAALDPLLSSIRTLVGGGGSRYPFVLLSYVERSDKLTRALAAALSELPARCRRRPLGRRAWVYELDMWDNWPSGREWPPFELETHPARWWATELACASPVVRRLRREGCHRHHSLACAWEASRAGPDPSGIPAVFQSTSGNVRTPSAIHGRTTSQRGGPTVSG